MKLLTMALLASGCVGAGDDSGKTVCTYENASTCEEPTNILENARIPGESIGICPMSVQGVDYSDSEWCRHQAEVGLEGDFCCGTITDLEPEVIIESFMNHCTCTSTGPADNNVRIDCSPICT